VKWGCAVLVERVRGGVCLVRWFRADGDDLMTIQCRSFLCEISFFPPCTCILD
jgi:hypothetical protein